MRGRIIGKIEEGRKNTRYLPGVDIAHSAASRLWKSFKPTGMCKNIRKRARHAVLWCGPASITGRTRLHVVANGTMTGQRYIEEVLLPHVHFSVVLSVINLFLWTTTQHVIGTLAVQIVTNNEGFQCLVWSARSPDLNPIENVWDAWGGKLLVETILRQTRTPFIRALTEEWDKIASTAADNFVQSMVRVCGMLHHTPWWTYPVLIPFFKVPTRTLGCIVPFLRTQIRNEHFFLSDVHSFCTFQNNKYSFILMSEQCGNYILSY
ncbi:hypothetical protein TNCV_1414501 [Trichonephila clavipes]|nr:hypothetical protein TNCV_1414501 [Trichonephila clavipes]